jgi:hypothetical protein
MKFFKGFLDNIHLYSIPGSGSAFRMENCCENFRENEKCCENKNFYASFFAKSEILFLAKIRKRTFLQAFLRKAKKNFSQKYGAGLILLVETQCAHAR